MPRFIRWVPTEQEFIDGFFELAPLSTSDIVYDLGSGDGRLLLAALEKGAGRCIGIEIDNDLILSSRDSAKNKGLDKKVTFIEDDVWNQDLSTATVVFCYLVSGAPAMLRSKFENELKPGTKVVMESFPVPGWKLSDTKEIYGRSFYLYVMPPERTEDYYTADSDTDWENDRY